MVLLGALVGTWFMFENFFGYTQREKRIFWLSTQNTIIVFGQQPGMEDTLLRSPFEAAHHCISLGG